MARKFGVDNTQSDELRARLKREQDEKAARMRKGERITSIILIIAGVIIIAGNVFSAINYKKLVAANDLQYSQLAEMLKKEQAKSEESGAGVIEIEEVSNSAEEAGIAVCAAQNDLTKIYQASVLNPETDYSAEREDALERVHEYIPAVSTNSNLASGTWSGAGIWEFNGIYSFVGEEIDVVWKCYMPDDADRDYLLAICTAHFHKNSDGRFIFDNTRLIYTTYYGMAVETVTPDQAGQYQGGDLE